VLAAFVVVFLLLNRYLFGKTWVESFVLLAITAALASLIIPLVQSLKQRA
jgi:Tfp pilus assembly major pilin PilA